MAYKPPHIDERAITIKGPHPATLEDAVLLKQCEIDTGRVSGPGGQNRNKVDTAVWIKHVPTEIETHAAYAESRFVGRVEGKTDSDSRISTCASWCERALGAGGIAQRPPPTAARC